MAAILVLSGAPGPTHAQTFSIDLEEVSGYLARTTPDNPFDTLRTDITHLTLGEYGRVPNFLPTDFERVHALEEFGAGGRYRVTFFYPRTHSFQFREERRGVFLYLQPRDLATPGLVIDVETIDQLTDRRYRESTRAIWRETVVSSINRQKIGEGGFGGLSFNVPIKLPGFMETMIGEGEKTHIDISGRESITFAGESRVVKPFIGSEGQQKQSLFPSLDMKQELDVRLNGQIGEKIHVQVDHSSNALSDNNNNIRLNYRGFDDDIIKLIELGNTNLSLPGSELVSFSTSSQGLFGIKTVAQIGPAEVTVIASKEEGEVSSATFVPQGATIGQRETRTILDYQFVANKFFFFDDPFKGIVPLKTDSIEVFRSIQLFE
ncbi:MAG: hypothetical protein O7D32_04045, partial [bacterium]|nr:hypothetical protein [bacterium]